MATEPAVNNRLAVDHMSALISILTRACNPNLHPENLKAIPGFVRQCLDFIEAGVPCGVHPKAPPPWKQGLALQEFVSHSKWARHPEVAELVKPLFAAYVRAGMIPVRVHPDSPIHERTGRLMHLRPLEQAVNGISSDTMVALLECGADPTEVGDDSDASKFIRSCQSTAESEETTALFRETVMRLRLEAAESPPAPGSAPRRRLGV